MVKDRETAVFFTCGICNLNCRYCNIDKNPILKDIDKILEESFKDDYYFNRVKKYFPNKWQLKTIETWGGEPFLTMDRIYKTLHSIINYYPYFNHMYSSTNFSYDTWLDQFYGLMDQFAMYEERIFNYTLQLSCDGPEYINDAGRGQGVTKKCLNNFNKLLETLPERLPKNVKLLVTLKPTLDSYSISELNSKEKIIEYYQFFENNFIIPLANLDCKNVQFILPIPNTASPAPTTQAQGIEFAALTKNCKEIEKEPEKYFKYYKRIMPYSSTICQTCLTYKYPHHTCGAGSSMIGFLPNDIIAICNESFTQIIGDYKRVMASNIKSKSGASITFDSFLAEQHCSLCVTDEQFEQFEKAMHNYNNPNTTARLGALTSMIVALAIAGQIEPIFIDQQNALKAAIFLQSHTAFCVKDNLNMTGSSTLTPIGRIRLLLNGAMQHIQEAEEVEGRMRLNDV